VFECTITWVVPAARKVTVVMGSECRQRRKTETAMLTPDLMAAKGFEENSKSAGLRDTFLLNVARKWVKRRLARRLP
jgi:hypothetical protein